MLETAGSSGDVPSVPLRIGPEADPHGGAPAQPRPRPTLLSLQAMANLYALWPALPDIELTFYPAGTIVGRVPAAMVPGEAEAALHAWREVLSADRGATLADTERVEGPFYWNQLAGQVTVYPPDAQPQRVSIIVIGRRWALARPLFSDAPGQATYSRRRR